MTCILFELYGVLVDQARLRPCAVEQLGQVMAERFGGSPQTWSAAHERIIADWDSYYADLDLNGEHGLDDLREGQIRTTRALFRISARIEPDRATLLRLAYDLPYLAMRGCDALYEDVKPALMRLCASGHTFGIASQATSAHARGMLEGGGIHERFTAPILTPDVTERFSKDGDFYHAAELPEMDCMVVDAQEEGLRGAKAAGMRAVQLLRSAKPSSPVADHVLRGGLDGLLSILGVKS